KAAPTNHARAMTMAFMLSEAWWQEQERNQVGVRQNSFQFGQNVFKARPTWRKKFNLALKAQGLKARKIIVQGNPDPPLNPNAEYPSRPSIVEDTPQPAGGGSNAVCLRCKADSPARSLPWKRSPRSGVRA